MNRAHQMINTRVCIDDTFGPFDCQLDPSHRWNGWLNPHFTLDATREVSAQTLRLADEYGYDTVDTIHVIEGREDSRDTVHIIEGGPSRYREEDAEDAGDPAVLAVAVHVPWRTLSRGGDASITDASLQARKAARKRKVTGRGASRVVVVHVRWQFLDEGSTTAASVEHADDEGLYSIGGFEWTRPFASWWCACGRGADWHETECSCGLTRDDQPKAPLGTAAVKVGQILRTLAPEATSALIDLTTLGHVCAVFAGESEIDTADDSGPFDTETLGSADEVLRTALDQAVTGDLSASGWEHVEDEQSAALYRITFSPMPTH